MVVPGCKGKPAVAGAVCLVESAQADDRQTIWDGNETVTIAGSNGWAGGVGRLSLGPGEQGSPSAGPGRRGFLVRIQPADGWAGVFRGGTAPYSGSQGWQSLGRDSQGRHAFDVRVSGVENPCRAAPGGAATVPPGMKQGFKRDGLGVPLARSHRLRCITALLVRFSLRPLARPSRVQHARLKLAFGSRTAMDNDSQSGSESQSPRDSTFGF